MSAAAEIGYTTAMSWHGRGRGARRGYHHGNLREALVEAALALIMQKGPAGFTFAEAARAAGVSPAAPYRHFRDREALMADVAKRGFARFAVVLKAAWDDGRPEPVRALGAVGRAYLEFARTEPAYFGAMFEAGLSFSEHPELHPVADIAFAVLHGAVEAIAATLPKVDRPPVMMMSLHLWAQVHGIASLFNRGDSARRPIPMPPEDLLEAATLIYLRGLGLGP